MREGNTKLLLSLVGSKLKRRPTHYFFSGPFAFCRASLLWVSRKHAGDLSSVRTAGLQKMRLLPTPVGLLIYHETMNYSTFNYVSYNLLFHELPTMLELLCAKLGFGNDNEALTCTDLSPQQCSAIAGNAQRTFCPDRRRTAAGLLQLAI